MSTGTIKFFNAAKGFGFVTPDGGGADVFLPGAAITAAGLAAIKPGQRITFEQAPDTKGPKVVSLTLLGDPPAKVAAPPAERVTIYCDSSADVTADIVEAVRDNGFALATEDYIATPPTVDQLKRLSQMLRVASQDLVRRYDPLFLALQLDDRFITDHDFWTAIVEHPALINGPVLLASGRARVCKTASEVRAFLRKDEIAAASKPKTLSPRIAAMLRGEAPPVPERAAPVEPQIVSSAPKSETRIAGKLDAKLKLAVKLKPKVAAKPAAAVPAKKAAPKKAVKPAKKPKKRTK